MTDRQVAIGALFAVAAFVGGAALLAKFQADLPQLPTDGNRAEGGTREQKGSGTKELDTPGGGAGDGGGKAADPTKPEKGGRAGRASEKKADAVAVARSPVLARWAVPKATADGKEDPHGTFPENVAVDDAGARVLVQTHRLVDVWRAGNPAALRVQPASIRGAHVAPDAARMYFVHDERAKLSLETCDADGRRVGVWEGDPNKWREFRAAGFDPVTSELTVEVGYDNKEALYAVSPATGRPRLVRALTDDAHGHFVDRIFPHSGGHLLQFHTFQGEDRPPGLYAVTADGGVRRTAAVPPGSQPSTVLRRPAVSPDGRRVAVPAGTGHVRVWDLASGRRLLEWQLDYYHPTACFFVNGRVVIAARSRYEKWSMGGPFSVTSVTPLPALLQMYDPDTAKPLGQFRPSDYKLPEAAFAFSPDGSKLAVAGTQEVALLDTNRAFGLDR